MERHRERAGFPGLPPKKKIAKSLPVSHGMTSSDEPVKRDEQKTPFPVGEGAIAAVLPRKNDYLYRQVDGGESPARRRRLSQLTPRITLVPDVKLDK